MNGLTISTAYQDTLQYCAAGYVHHRHGHMPECLLFVLVWVMCVFICRRPRGPSGLYKYWADASLSIHTHTLTQIAENEMGTYRMGPLFRAYAFSMDTLFRTPTYVVNLSIGIGNPVHDLSTHLGTPMITAIQHT